MGALSMTSAGLKKTPQVAATVSYWPHRLAVALLCSTWLLICVGGLVTTQGAGMAFKDWPTSDGSNMFLYPWFRAANDKFVEHGHRLFGALVGMIAIALCLSLWLKENRRWMAWMGVLALVLVIVQGVLGGMRVRGNDVQLAKIHGCIAPLFFSLVVAIAVCTSRWWREGRIVRCIASGRLKRLAVVTATLAYLQLVLGAQLRHVAPEANGDLFRIALVFHLVVAAILFFDVVFLFLLAIKNLRGEKVLLRPTQFLLGLVVLQLFLGMGTWVLKYSWPAGIFSQSRLVAGWTNTAGGITESLVITGHVAIGSLILGVAVMAGLRFCHGARNVSSPQAKSYPLMGVTT